MYKEVSIIDVLNINNIPIIDVRSPSEFKAGHIPGALNLPLFTDEERKNVGITYKHQGKKEAMLTGLSMVGPRLRSMVETSYSLAKKKELLVHCWRGGQRSKSVAWLLQNSGLEISLLKEGYKAYRNFIHIFFESNKFKLVVLGGRTGTGKTQIIRELKLNNEQIIDLEKLAHHKGSAFGWIGEEEQETNEQFENNLFQELYRLDKNRIIWFENESKTIGRNYIPDSLWKKMKISPLINIEIGLELRLQNLIDCYNVKNKDALIISFEKIVKRLGHECANNAIELLRNNEFYEAAKIALSYYDKCYDYNLKENISPEIYNLKFEYINFKNIALELIKFKNKQFE